MTAKNADPRVWGHVRPSADGLRWSGYPAGNKPYGSYTADFTTAAIESEISLGGIWTNNSQGTGGNGVMGTLASLQIDLASDGVTKIAQHATAAIVDLNDSFGLVPVGITANQRVTATVYRGSGYSPSNPHEIELLLGGGVRGANNRHWIECLKSVGGDNNIILLDGAYGTYVSLGLDGGAGAALANGQAWVGELDRVNQEVRTYIDGTLDAIFSWSVANKPGMDAGLRAQLNSMGSSAGIAAYRIGGGGTASNALGFSNFSVVAF